MQGHVGVYVGGGMAVDCRSDAYNIVYEGVTQHRWVKWYKVPGVSYPTTGWVTFQGEKYYYENGQYVVNTTKTIDGVSYTFGWNGKITSSNGNPVAGGGQSSSASKPKPSGNSNISGNKTNTQKPASSQPKAEPTYTKPVSYTHLDVYKRQDRTRTGTVSPPRDFKSLASADFATPA